MTHFFANLLFFFETIIGAVIGGGIALTTIYLGDRVAGENGVGFALLILGILGILGLCWVLP